VTVTVPGDSPLARAVRTKSDASTASIDALVIRAIGASENSANVVAGSTSWPRAARNVSGSRATRLSIK
jgi:hypothetical protein